jgi:hypothetical protein
MGSRLDRPILCVALDQLSWKDRRLQAARRLAEAGGPAPATVPAADLVELVAAEEGLDPLAGDRGSPACRANNMLLLSPDGVLPERNRIVDSAVRTWRGGTWAVLRPVLPEHVDVDVADHTQARYWRREDFSSSMGSPEMSRSMKRRCKSPRLSLGIASRN